MAEIPASRHVLKDGTDITIRTGIESDACQFLDCVRASVLDGVGHVQDASEIEMTEEKAAEWIMSKLQNQSEIFLVAEHDGNLIGSLQFVIGKRRRLAHSGELGMSLIKEWRNRGPDSCELSKWMDSMLTEYLHNLARNVLILIILNMFFVVLPGFASDSKLVVAIQPLGPVAKALVEAVKSEIISKYDVNVAVRPGVDLPPEAFYKARNRYRSG